MRDGSKFYLFILLQGGGNVNKRGPSAGRGENFGVNNFSNEWVFFSSPFSAFLFLFFFLRRLLLQDS
jgi:hypothetical protein